MANLIVGAQQQQNSQVQVQGVNPGGAGVGGMMASGMGAGQGGELVGNQRPGWVTMLVILGFLMVVYSLLSSILPLVMDLTEDSALASVFPIELPTWYMIVNILISLLFVVMFIFILGMKKWALISYAILAVVGVVLAFFVDVGLVGIIVDAIYVLLAGIFFLAWGKMQ